MKNSNPLRLLISILLLATLACSTATPVPAAVPSVDVNAAIAQTAAAAMTQTALFLPPETATSTVTFTATNTATETPTATLLFSPTPQTPMISVSISTNCRSGPGKVYDYQSALIVGMTVEIFAREPTGSYWYIRNPEATDEQYCWIWGKYATIAGDVSVLPVYTPPPTPTATATSATTVTPTEAPTKQASPGSFVVSYNNTDTCSPDWWTDFRLRNNGSLSFQSLKISIKDLFNNQTVDKTSNVFTDLAGCATLSDKDVLDPADILLFSGPVFSYDPTGHKLRVSLTLCTSNGLKGTCIKQNFDVQL